LPEILLLLLGATLAGADDLVEIELGGQQQLRFLRRFRPDTYGISSHDPLGAVLGALDPALFKACFTSWVESRREEEPELIAVDGKTARRSHARAKGREPLHLVSAWAARQRLVLGQEAVAGTSSQIVAIPRLLERLALQGARVTIDRSAIDPVAKRAAPRGAAGDAIGTQGATAETIRARGGDHLLALKANRAALLEEVAAFVADPPPGALLRHATTGGGHGRIESRRHAIGHQVARLLADRRHPGEITFPDLAMLGPAASPPPLRGIGPVARWSRPRPSAAARSSGSDAAISARPSSILRASPGRRAGTGGSRTGRPGSWTWCSATIFPGCAAGRSGEHGGRQAHGFEPAAPGQAHRQPEKPPQARRLEPRRSRPHHPRRHVTPFTRLPWRLARGIAAAG
jgi:hypothetical protein